MQAAAHRNHFRSDARVDRGPIATAGAQAAAKEAAVIGILHPISTDNSADGLHAVRKWLAKWAARAIWITGLFDHTPGIVSQTLGAAVASTT
jgi:hypothetical protein